MSWLTSLSETYDNFYADGKRDNVKKHSDCIVPVGFISKKAFVTVYLDRNGKFVSAAIDSNNNVIMPSIPSAVAKTGDNPAPFPLYDELKYTAGDLSEIVGADYGIYFESYIKALREWAAEDNAPHVLSVLLNYLEEKTLASDILASSKIQRKKLNSKGVVEFCIYDDAIGDAIRIADMPSVRDSWTKRLEKLLGKPGLCYASGNVVPIATTHSKIYGNSKFISSKDTQTIFQYKGRFTSAEEACTIGYDTSEKAYNTLRWLIDRQGYKNGRFKFVAWSKDCSSIVQPDDVLSELLEEEDETVLDTAEDYSRRLASRLAGFHKNISRGSGDHVILLGTEQATDGRESIDYYSELGGDEYLARLEKWYTGCCWRLSWKDKNEKQHTGIITPRIDSMARAVFGGEAVSTANNDSACKKAITKQVQKFSHDILYCISGGGSAPAGYTMMAYHRALKPQSFHTRKNSWLRNEWTECMGVALAMLKSLNKKGEYKVALDTKETDRSYRFGRLLAVADVIEEKALRGRSERMTNAARMFTSMQQHPAATWSNLENKLIPYLAQLTPGSRSWFRGLIDEICSTGPDMMTGNSSLTPRFIEGYHNQRYELLHSKNEKENN